jgi:ABC-type multidrug transport system ATPase subunit
MLTGLIEPSEGQIFYEGRSVHEDFTAFQRRIGYVPEEATSTRTSRGGSICN